MERLNIYHREDCRLEGRISRCCNDTQGKLDKYKCSSYFLTVLYTRKR